MHAKEKYKKLQNFLTLWKESTEEIKKKKTLYCNIADEKKKKKKFLFAKEKKELTRLCPIVERLQIQNQV